MLCSLTKSIEATVNRSWCNLRANKVQMNEFALGINSLRVRHTRNYASLNLLYVLLIKNHQGK